MKARSQLQISTERQQWKQHTLPNIYDLGADHDTITCQIIAGSEVAENNETTKDKNFPILIDEEGTNVSRLDNLINHNIDAKFFGNLYEKDKKFAINLYKSYLISLCNYLKNIGININTIPVLDVLRKNTNKIISNRSFSNKTKIVKELGDVCVKTCISFKKAGACSSESRSGIFT